MVDNVAHAIAKTALDFSWPTSRSRISQRCLPSPALVIGSFLASILLRPIRKTPSHSRHTLLTTSTTFPSSMCPGDHAVVTDDFPTQNAKETYSYIVQYSFSFFFFFAFLFPFDFNSKAFFSAAQSLSENIHPRSFWPPFNYECHEWSLKDSTARVQCCCLLLLLFIIFFLRSLMTRSHNLAWLRLEQML